MLESCLTTAETVDIGRARNGRFIKGNSFAKGNPYTKQVANLRRTLVNAVTEKDIADVMESLVMSARNGDTAAAKLVLTYTVGHPQFFESPDLKVSTNLLEANIHILLKEINTKLTVLDKCPELLQTTQKAFETMVENAAV